MNQPRFCSRQPFLWHKQDSKCQHWWVESHAIAASSTSTISYISQKASIVSKISIKSVYYHSRLHQVLNTPPPNHFLRHSRWMERFRNHNNSPASRHCTAISILPMPEDQGPDCDTMRASCRTRLLPNCSMCKWDAVPYKPHVRETHTLVSCAAKSMMYTMISHMKEVITRQRVTAARLGLCAGVPIPIHHRYFEQPSRIGKLLATWDLACQGIFALNNEFLYFKYPSPKAVDGKPRDMDDSEWCTLHRIQKAIRSISTRETSSQFSRARPSPCRR